MNENAFDIQQDTEDNQCFQMQIEAKIKEFNKNGSKNYARPMSSIVKKSPTLQNSLIKDQNLKSVYCELSKFINFIEYHKILPWDIWEENVELSLNEFALQIQKKIGYKLTNAEMAQILKLAPHQALQPHHFLKIGLWTNTINRKMTTSPSLLESAGKRFSTRNIHSNKNNLNLSKVTSEKNENKFIKTQFSSNSRSIFGKTTTLSIKQRLSEKMTNNFFKMDWRTEKQIKGHKKDKMDIIREDIQTNALEKKWDFVVMAGEMNKWIDETGPQKDKENDSSSHSYFQIINQTDSFLIVKKNKSGEDQIISENVFIKKYNTMKKKFSSLQNEKRKIKEASIPIVEDLLKSKGITQTKSHNQRDYDLNHVLLHIMRTKNIFHYQNKLLIDAGVNI